MGIPTTQGGSDKQRQPTELAVVIPTFNERDNVTQLLDGLEVALKGIAWEAIVVDDDSPDGTADLVRQIAQQKQQVRVIHRIGRRGLASACVEGVLSSSAPYFAVIDADMQHDETLLPRMLEELKERRSRYCGREPLRCGRQHPKLEENAPDHESGLKLGGTARYRGRP